MKKFLKVTFALLLLVVTLAPLSSNVFAFGTIYESKLEMAINTIWTGKERQYYEHNYSITIRPDSFYSFDRCSLTADLYKKDLIGKTFLAGDTQTLRVIGEYHNRYMGYFDPCKAFYYFETGRDGGIISNYVAMSSRD